MLVKQLIDAIASEKARIWGENHFHGDPEQRVWLLNTYGVTQEDDATWSAVLLHEFEGVQPDGADEKMSAFLSNRNALAHFLYVLLRKYRSAHKVYPD